MEATQTTTMTLEQALKELMENCPECSESLQCISWKYEDCIFKFRDYEDNQVYTVDLPKLVAATKVPDARLLKLSEPYENWLEITDGETVDILIQLACFGEVIYG